MFVLTSDTYKCSSSRKTKPSSKKTWGIVEFVSEYFTPGDLANYIEDGSPLKDIIRSIKYYYDNDVQKIVFIVRTARDYRIIDGVEQPACYFGHELDYLKEPLIEYINGQISDGWGEGGIMLASHVNHTDVIEVCVEPALCCE